MTKDKKKIHYQNSFKM